MAAGIDVGGNMAGRPSLEEKNNLRNENITEKQINACRNVQVQYKLNFVLLFTNNFDLPFHFRTIIVTRFSSP